MLCPARRILAFIELSESRILLVSKQDNEVRGFVILLDYQVFMRINIPMI